MSVLVLVDWVDPTADALVTELSARGVPVTRIDPAWFPEQFTVSAELPGTGWIGRIGGGPDEVDLARVTGVFYRRPRGYAFDLGLAGGPDPDVAGQARLGLGGLLAAVGSWANHPHRSSYTEYMPVQLRAAQEVGLRVPRTCVTDDPDTARRFLGEVGPAVRKPFRGHDIDDGWPALAVPVLVTRDDCDERVARTVHLFQQWIAADHAVRLTVVDGRVFAARSASGPTDPDWCPTDVEPPVRRGVAAFVGRFGLRFAALDFVVDAGRRWWFIGCDPNARWADVEQRAGLPITDALADALVDGPGGSRCPRPEPVRETAGRPSARPGR